MGGTLQTFWSDREWRIKNAPLLQACLLRGGIGLDLNDEQLAEKAYQGITSYHRWSRESKIELPPLKIWSRFILKGHPISEETLAPIAEELTYIYETRFYCRTLRPEVPQVLRQIKAMGLRIGCISNTICRGQVPDNLKEYGILDYFNPIILSSEYGTRKPDPSIFYHAVRSANLPSGACIYVGDRISADILGAHRAGFRMAVQIQHDFANGDPDEGDSPDAFIQNMRELLPLLESEKEKGFRSTEAVRKRKIKAIFFDAGGILYYKPHKGKHIRQFFRRYKITAPEHIVREKLKLKDQAFQGKLDRHEYYAMVIRLYGVTDPQVIEEGATALLLDATTVEIVPGVPETMRKLKDKGFILGIITDTATPISTKLDWFDRAGFGRVWDTIISSKEIQIRKPAPTIYQEALIRTGTKAEEAVFVGHKTSELKGAKAVGMTTIALNYTKSGVADVFIDAFTDLEKISLLDEFAS